MYPTLMNPLNDAQNEKICRVLYTQACKHIDTGK